MMVMVAMPLLEATLPVALGRDAATLLVHVEISAFKIALEVSAVFFSHICETISFAKLAAMDLSPALTEFCVEMACSATKPNIPTEKSKIAISASMSITPACCFLNDFFLIF